MPDKCTSLYEIGIGIGALIVLVPLLYRIRPNTEKKSSYLLFLTLLILVILSFLIGGLDFKGGNG